MSDYVTEAEALADIDDGCYEEFDYDKFLLERDQSIMSDYLHYRKNKEVKVGMKIQCAENRCRKTFKKKSYQQAFCCTKHKDQFWNRQRLNDF